jgi:hypothetical protein
MRSPASLQGGEREQKPRRPSRGAFEVWVTAVEPLAKVSDSQDGQVVGVPHGLAQ